MRTIIGTLVIVGLLAVAGGLVFIYSGQFDVSASSGHSAVARWVLNTTMERSVENHAAGIKPPPLDDPAFIKQGFQRYDTHCVKCHGAPGAAETALQKGLTPQPPHLDKREHLEHLNPAEAFWIIKHGIKMTAMPAWEVAFSDQQIWQLVAFLKKLPGLTPEEYRALQQQSANEKPSASPAH